jgi:hypothetical protein
MISLNKTQTIVEKAPFEGSKGKRVDTTDETNETNCLIIKKNDNTFLFNLNHINNNKQAKINFKLPKNECDAL